MANFKKKGAPKRIKSRLRIAIRKNVDENPQRLVDDNQVMNETDALAKIRIKKR